MTTVAGLSSLDELRRVYRVTQLDRTHQPAQGFRRPTRWTPGPGERVVLVCGCGGSSGATTVAVALATVAGRARVVETCSGKASGLGFAATAELGGVERGWLRGSRDSVVLERRTDTASASDLPIPADTDLSLAIVDSSFELAGLLASPGWLGELARTASAVVLVATATVPGLRRLDTAADLMGESRVIAATVGAKRWPRPVEQSVGPTVRRLREAGRVVQIPHEPGLAIAGLTPDPLPTAITRPARTLLALLEGPLS